MDRRRRPQAPYPPTRCPPPLRPQGYFDGDQAVMMRRVPTSAGEVGVSNHTLTSSGSRSRSSSSRRSGSRSSRHTGSGGGSILL